MTATEAIQGAIERHAFRCYVPQTIHAPAPVEGVVAECWCGAQTPPFLHRENARAAHVRHQQRELREAS